MKKITGTRWLTATTAGLCFIGLMTLADQAMAQTTTGDITWTTSYNNVQSGSGVTNLTLPQGATSFATQGVNVSMADPSGVNSCGNCVASYTGNISVPPNNTALYTNYLYMNGVAGVDGPATTMYQWGSTVQSYFGLLINSYDVSSDGSVGFYAASGNLIDSISLSSLISASGGQTNFFANFDATGGTPFSYIVISANSSGNNTVPGTEIIMADIAFATQAMSLTTQGQPMTTAPTTPPPATPAPEPSAGSIFLLAVLALLAVKEEWFPLRRRRVKTA